MAGRPSELFDVAMADKQFAFEAYEFLHHALAYTQRMLGHCAETVPPGGEAQPQHVSGQELLEGVRRFAIEQFGMMASVVFHEWGLRGTGDFGVMVFRLIDAGLWHKSPTDSIDDFVDLYDFEEEFVHRFRIELEAA